LEENINIFAVVCRDRNMAYIISIAKLDFPTVAQQYFNKVEM